MPLPLVFDNAVYGIGFICIANGSAGNYTATDLSPFNITLNGQISQAGDTVTAVAVNNGFNLVFTALDYDDAGSMAFSSGGTIYIISNSAISPNQAFSFTEQNLGDYTPLCFVAGTMIATSSGFVPIEQLSVGDLVRTHAGALRPVKWLGHRQIDLRELSPALRAASQPILIAKDAFTPGRPARDLLVSPGHALCVDMLGEVLIPAGRLVNGASIRQLDLSEVEYWHVELDSHDVILAEDMPCESYIDCGNRTFFSGATGEADGIRHDLGDYCRLFVDKGAVVEAARERLLARAGSLGWAKTEDPDIHLVVDGQRIEATKGEGRARFLVPAGAHEVKLRSHRFQPLWTGSPDERELGISVRGLRVLDGFDLDRTVDLTDEWLGAGFHRPETDNGHSRRWTDGDARLPPDLWAGCAGDLFLVVDYDPAGSFYWQAPSKATSTFEADNILPLRRQA